MTMTAPQPLSMICLAPVSPETLAVPGGDPPGDLHLTLMFLGAADAWSPDVQSRIDDALDQVASFGASIQSEVSGIVSMGGDSDGGMAVCLLCQDPDVVAVAQIVAMALGSVGVYDQSEHPTFIPHVTLGYGLDPSDPAVTALVGTTVAFGSIQACYGADVHDHPLGVPVLEPGLDAEPDPNDPNEPNEPASEEMMAVTVPSVWNQALSEARAAVRRRTFAEAFDHADYARAVEDALRLPVPTGVADVPAAVVPVAVPAFAPASSAPAATADVSLVENFADVSYAVDPATGEWHGVLVVEGMASGDGRMITPGALTWRELPLPLMVMFSNPGGGAGHAGAQIGGRTDWIERREGAEPGTYEIWGGGVLDMDSPAGAEAARLIEGRFLRGVSADLDDLVAEYERMPDPGMSDEELARFDPGLLVVTQGRIMGETLCPFPAFQEATVELGRDPGIDPDADPTALDPAVLEPVAAALGPARHQARTWLPVGVADRALVAAGAPPATPFPVAPPLAWFDEANVAFENGPHGVRVSPEGRVYGLLGPADQCHLSVGPRCVTPPRGDGLYRYFQNKAVLTAEGVEVATGPIFANTVHPDLEWAASDAYGFYADTGAALADVVVFDTVYGPAVAGAMRPAATAADARVLRGSDVSPDWRPIRTRNGRVTNEMVALVAVNSSGFVTPALVASAGPHWTMPGRVRARFDGAGNVIAMVGMPRGNGGALDGDTVALLRDEVAGLRAAVDDLTRPIRLAAALERLDSLALS